MEQELAYSFHLGSDKNRKNISKQTILDTKRVFGKSASITYDNGSEFTMWRQTEKQLDTIIYFANPYHSWERGRNENANGLIRDFLPKGTDFKKITKADILEVESLINNRPRKRLHWLTPMEYYKSQGSTWDINLALWLTFLHNRDII